MMTMMNKKQKKEVMQSLFVQSTSRGRVWWDTKAGMVEEEAEEAQQRQQEDVAAPKSILRRRIWWGQEM